MPPPTRLIPPGPRLDTSLLELIHFQLSIAVPEFRGLREEHDLPVRLYARLTCLLKELSDVVLEVRDVLARLPETLIQLPHTQALSSADQVQSYTPQLSHLMRYSCTRCPCPLRPTILRLYTSVSLESSQGPIPTQ